MATLSGKTALVTGASRGSGRASALALARLGAQVLIHYGRAADEAEAVAKQIRAAGGRAQTVAADLAAPDGDRHIAVGDQAAEALGDAAGLEQRRHRDTAFFEPENSPTSPCGRASEINTISVP